MQGLCLGKVVLFCCQNGNCLQIEKLNWQEKQLKIQLDRDRYWIGLCSQSWVSCSHITGKFKHCLSLSTQLQGSTQPCVQYRLSQQVSGLERQLIQLKAGVQQELDDGGYRLGPVKSRLQEMLADFSTSPRSLTTQQLQQASQPPLPRQQGSSPVPVSQANKILLQICLVYGD